MDSNKKGSSENSYGSQELKDSVKDIDQIKQMNIGQDLDNYEHHFSRQGPSFSTAPSSNASKYDKFGMASNLNQEKNTFKQKDIRKLSAAEEIILKHQSERVASNKLANDNLTDGMGVDNLEAHDQDEESKEAEEGSQIPGDDGQEEEGQITP